jgi:hypothetical protein
MNVYDLNPNFERDLACYTRMVNRLKQHGIEFLGVDGHTVVFEKNDKKFSHSLSTWQCVPDPTRPAFTEDLVVGWVIEAFEKIK